MSDVREAACIVLGVAAFCLAVVSPAILYWLVS